MSTLVITPTYNEADNIEKFVESILDLNLEVLIIDDNSPDGTSKLVQKYVDKYDSVHLILRKQKLGLGSAYREGFKWALDKNYHYIIEMDADFSHQFSDLEKLLKSKNSGGLVIGSRYTKGGKTQGWSFIRKQLSLNANRITRISKNSSIKDMTSGFRVYSKEALLKSNYFDSQLDGYAFQIDMVLRCLNSGINVIEVPITFIERQNGASKMNRSIIFEAIKFLIS